MPRNARRTITVRKVTSNKIDSDRINKQVVECCQYSIGTTLRNRGWTARKPHVETTDLPNGRYTYLATVNFYRDGAREFTEESTDQHFSDITRKFLSRGQRWNWSTPDAEIMSLAGDYSNKAKPIGVPEFAGSSAIHILDNWKIHFENIYDRDDQINEIVQSIRTAKESNMEIRNHVLMYGPPGVGKTEIGLSLERMLGPEVVLKLDATNTTKAGAENLILEREPIPPILILEELEKCNENNLPWLLGILDDRGEIIKTNARIGSMRRRAPMLVICTVNNLTKFQQFQEGALANRFNVPLYFGMPDRDLLKRILIREVVKIPDGKIEWVEPALDFALNVERTYQARRIKAILTNGRDALLSGEYQESRKRMMKRETDDRAVLKEKFDTTF